MDDDQNASTEQQNVSENEDVSGIGDGSNDSMELADSESFFEEIPLENDEYERDGRIDHSLPPPESSMVEIDMDDLGETQLPITSCVGQQLANSANSAQDAEDTGAVSREVLPNLQTLVQVGELQSSMTLELTPLNQNEAYPPLFGILTSPPTEGMSHSEQAVVCAPTSAELMDCTASDLGLELLHFLNTLDNTASPIEEKLETAETKKALETVR